MVDSIEELDKRLGDYLKDECYLIIQKSEWAKQKRRGYIAADSVCNHEIFARDVLSFLKLWIKKIELKGAKMKEKSCWNIKEEQLLEFVDDLELLDILDKKGYVLVKKDKLIKEAGLIVSEKLGVK